MTETHEFVIRHDVHLFGLVESKYALRVEEMETDGAEIKYDLELLIARRLPFVGWVL